MPFRKMITGFFYHFNAARPVNEDDQAQRAGFLMYQTLPANSIAGAGQYVEGGNYWEPTSPANVPVIQMPILSDLVGGGSVSGTVNFLPLVDTTGSIG